MTWLKTSDDFPDQCVDLSDAAYRTHHEALSWAMRRENGGRIPYREIKRFAESEDAQAAVQELLTRGFWEDDGRAYQILHHMEHQPEPELIEQRRKNSADRQRKYRYRKAGLSQRDVTRDATRDPGRVGTGRDGPPYKGNK